LKYTKKIIKRTSSTHDKINETDTGSKRKHFEESVKINDLKTK